jgi:hypothetical protein
MPETLHVKLNLIQADRTTYDLKEVSKLTLGRAWKQQILLKYERMKYNKVDVLHVIKAYRGVTVYLH